MKKYFIYVLTLTSFSCNNSDQGKYDNKHLASNMELSAVNIADMTLENTVSITVLDKDRQPLALGSGVIIDNGKVITNVHVVAGAKFGYVQHVGGKEKLDIEGYYSADQVNDLVLLSVPEIKTNHKISIHSDYPKVGERIYAAGNPQGLSGTFSEGNVSAIREIGQKTLIQISAPISPGSSGGAIVNSNGELVGIAVGAMENGQNLNFAIPISILDSLLSRHYSNSLSITLLRSEVSKTDKDIKSAINFISVKNITWYYDCGDNVGMISNPPDNPLVEFSIFNQLNRPIRDVIIFIIIYDRDGSPVDYEMVETGWKIGTIMPGLAKKYENIECSYGDYLSYRDRGSIKLSKKRGYKAVFRILDYKTVKE